MTITEDSVAAAAGTEADSEPLPAGRDVLPAGNRSVRGRKPNTWALLVLVIALCAAAAGIIRWSLDVTSGNGERPQQPLTADAVQQMTRQVEANTHLTAGQKATIIDSLRRRVPQ